MAVGEVDRVVHLEPLRKSLRVLNVPLDAVQCGHEPVEQGLHPPCGGHRRGLCRRAQACLLPGQAHRHLAHLTKRRSCGADLVAPIDHNFGRGGAGRFGDACAGLCLVQLGHHRRQRVGDVQGAATQRPQPPRQVPGAQRRQQHRGRQHHRHHPDGQHRGTHLGAPVGRGGRLDRGQHPTGDRVHHVRAGRGHLGL